MQTFLEFYYAQQTPKLDGGTLYHGTNIEFDVYDVNKFGQTDCGTLGPGFYLTGLPDEAMRYAENTVRYRKEGHPVVLEFRVKAGRTLSLHSNNASVWEDKMRSMGIAPGTVYQNAQELMKKGYDSIVIMEGTFVREMVLMKPGLAERIS